jgi:hypothetical protein
VPGEALVRGGSELDIGPLFLLKLLFETGLGRAVNALVQKTQKNKRPRTKCFGRSHILADWHCRAD